MIGWLAGKALSAGIGATLPEARRFTVIALVTAGVIALGIGGCIAKNSYDRSIIKNDRLEAAAEGAKRDLLGDRKAGQAAGAASDQFTAEQAKIKEAQDDAIRNDPAGAARPVGPSSRSYYDSLPDAAPGNDRKTTGGAPAVR